MTPQPMCWLTLWPKHQWHTTDIKWEWMKCRKHQGHISWTHHQQTTEAKQEEMKYHKCQFVTKFRSSNLEKTQFFRKKWSSIIRKTDLKFCCHVSKSYWSIIWLYIQQNKTVYLLQHVIHFFFDTFGKYILIQGILLRDLLIANKQ